MQNVQVITVKDIATVTVDLDNTLANGKLFVAGIQLLDNSEVLANVDGTATLWFDLLPALAAEYNLDEASFMYLFATIGLDPIADTYGF